MPQTPSDPHQPATPNTEPPSRRDFMVTVTRVALGGAAVALGAGALVMAYPDELAERVTVLGRYELAVGSLVFVPRHELFLTRTAAGIGAFSARCTHLGCIVRQSGAGLVCPCHGATYDHDGRVQNGPARRDLPWLTVKVNADSTLSVMRAREVDLGTVAPLGLERTR